MLVLVTLVPLPYNIGEEDDDVNYGVDDDYDVVGMTLMMFLG